MQEGNLIVIEGASDGCGKSTQLELLKQELEKKYQILTHHFPSYKTSQGAGVEDYLAGKYGEIKDLSPYFVNTLYAYDRAITWQTKLKQHYMEGGIILLDRYTTSSLIYQSSLIKNVSEKKKFLDYVYDYEYNKLGIKKPDLVIFLTMNYDLIKELRKKRIGNDGIDNDIHERDNAFMKRVYDNSVFVANYFKWHIINCDNNGSLKDIEDISSEVKKAVYQKILR